MEKFFIVHVLILSCLVLIPSTHQLPSSQTQVLRQLRKQLENPKQLDSWVDAKDVCYITTSDEMSVVCEENSVTQLKIRGERLTKLKTFEGYAIPNDSLSNDFSVDSLLTTLSRLPSLRVLILVSLGIWGPLPDKIDRLESLEVLDLSSNFLYGSIPKKISTMARLHTLTLDGNYFNGTVPDWFRLMPNLTSLSLQKNKLIGSLPASLGQVKALTTLALSSNSLSGEIPNLSGLSSLSVLDLRDNLLGSEIPALPKGLVTLLLNKNSLKGKIPQQFGVLNQLQHIDLSFNMLDGSPPEALFSLPNISYVNLASNMLSGSLPGHMSCGKQLGYVDISTNRLTGGLPSCLTSDLVVSKFNENCLNVNSQHQHEIAYCQGIHKKSANLKAKGIGLLVAVLGGVTLLAVLLLFAVLLCRKSCHRAISEQRLLPRPLVENGIPGLSTELLVNARYISEAKKPGKQVFPTYRMFSIEELKEATKNFDRSSYIGEGSMGKLYKGRLENGNYVAIRCLALFKRDSIRNLKLRLDLLSKLRHPHLVCLMGHCIDSAPDDFGVNKVFLVYEYIPNGNLRDHLSERNLSKVLKWSDRLTVLLGIAKAIQFLHTGVIPGIFNNRMKTNNVLLDEHWVAKLSDYGLSIITEEIQRYEAKTESQKSNHSKSPPSGETVMPEDDVCSFGLILLEALVGPELTGKEAYFANKLATLTHNQDERKHILDPIVIGTSSQDSLSVVISITNKCLSAEVSSRPSLEDVLWNLQYAAQIQGTADGDQRSDVASQS